MKKSIFAFTVLLLSMQCKIISQNSIEINSPFQFGASYTGDFVNNTSGGIKTGSQYLGMANLNISFNTGTAGLWNNGLFFLNAANTHGGLPTNELIGDFQGITNIEAGDITYLHEFWYMQSFDKFSVIAGLQDLAADFAVSEYGSLFLNGSFGTHSTIADNVPSPIFPLTALGVQVQVSLSNRFTLKAALFDGMPDEYENNRYNLSWKLSNNDGIFSISEINYKTVFQNDLEGTYKLGAYYHNHIPGHDSEESDFTNNYGLYGVADQMLYNGENKLAVFMQTGLSPYRKNDNYFYFGTGLNYSGLFTENGEDILGLGIAFAGLHNKNFNNETTLELSYFVNLTENISVQPDIQYVMNPSGTEEILDNALAATLRMGINF